MRGKEQGAEEDANTGDNHIGNTQERIFASHDGPSADEDRLGSAIDPHWEVYPSRSVTVFVPKT